MDLIEKMYLTKTNQIRKCPASFEFLFNPDYALDFVMKTKGTIKLSTHGLFLDKQYFYILNLGDF